VEEAARSMMGVRRIAERMDHLRTVSEGMRISDGLNKKNGL
jgi:hypothetical protein